MSLHDLTAADLMSRDVLTIEASETLRAAARRMTESHVHCLVVPPTRPGACVGVITVKDVVQLLVDGDSAVLDQLLVADAMSTPAVTVQQGFLVTDCLRLMRISGVRSAPVLDGMRLVGLLSFTDVVRRAASGFVQP